MNIPKDLRFTLSGEQLHKPMTEQVGILGYILVKTL